MCPQNQPNQQEREGPVLKSLSDDDLLRRWYNGDERAFTVLYNKYYPAAIPFCIKFCKSRAVSKDIAQETLTKVYYKVQGRKGDRIKCFSDYLFTALSMNCLQYLRRPHYRKEESLDAKVIPLKFESSADARIDHYVHTNSIEAILNLLENLDQRKAFHEYLKGNKYEEIAEDLGITKGQVRGLLARAKNNLRNSKEKILKLLDLEPQGDDPLRSLE